MQGHHCRAWRAYYKDCDAAGKVFRLLLTRRQHGQVAGFNTAGKLTRRKYIELIKVTARNPDLKLRAHIIFPDLHRLIGKSIDEISNHDSALPLHHPAQRRSHCLAVVDAPDGLTNARIKRLYPEGKPVDARMHRCLNLALCKVMDAPLKRNFTVARERQTRAHSMDKTRNIGI